MSLQRGGMMGQIDAWVATAAKQELVRQQIDLGPLGDEEVEVRVEHCGLCHSDLSMLNNDWGWSRFPAVLGHEAVGTVVAVGRAAKGIQVGQKVGVGWTAQSCMHCRRCLSGEHHLCAQAVPTIVGLRGGLAGRVRAHWAWAILIASGPKKAPSTTRTSKPPRSPRISASGRSARGFPVRAFTSFEEPIDWLVEGAPRLEETV